MLPDVEGTSVHRYPLWFENFGWLKPVRTVETGEVERWGKTFAKLLTDQHNQIKIASRRLDLCSLRESEEDAVLDATIAMECLLTSDGNQEMTHKLALRVAALVKLATGEPDSAAAVFHAVKDIYQYRSAIVHGSTKAAKKREITVGGQEKVAAVTLALRYLRVIMSVLLDYPDYLDNNKIDERLLLALGA